MCSWPYRSHNTCTIGSCIKKKASSDSTDVLSFSLKNVFHSSVTIVTVKNVLFLYRASIHSSVMHFGDAYNHCHFLVYIHISLTRRCDHRAAALFLRPERTLKIVSCTSSCAQDDAVRKSGTVRLVRVAACIFCNHRWIAVRMHFWVVLRRGYFSSWYTYPNQRAKRAPQKATVINKVVRGRVHSRPPSRLQAKFRKMLTFLFYVRNKIWKTKCFAFQYYCSANHSKLPAAV